MNETLAKNISIFLRSPNDFDGQKGVYSTLYLLRRDASLCFGYDPNNNQKIGFKALFPATMAILAGIDLVAKFIYGDSPNEVSQRYKNYVSSYFGKEYKVELYQLRNALLHSFGLYSEDRNGVVYHFILDRRVGELIAKVSDKSYLINIDYLWRKFEESIVEYHKELMVSTDLQQVFTDMFPKYGVIGIR